MEESYEYETDRRRKKKEDPSFMSRYWGMYYDQLDYKQGIYLAVILLLIALFIYFAFFWKKSESQNLAIGGTAASSITKSSEFPFMDDMVQSHKQEEPKQDNISKKLDSLINNMNSKIEELEKKQKVNSYARPGKFLSKGEAECRRCAEEIFGVPFKNGYPPWLISKKKRQMEIDVYNEDLKIGIEYNGEQHYNPKSSLHRNKADYQNLKERDELKRKLCDENGVYLITVPHTVPLDQIKDYIIYYMPESHQNRVDAGMSA